MTHSVKTAVDDGLTLKSVCSASWILPAMFLVTDNVSHFLFEHLSN